jgi:hypothetical protein
MRAPTVRILLRIAEALDIAPEALVAATRTYLGGPRPAAKLPSHRRQLGPSDRCVDVRREWYAHRVLGNLVEQLETGAELGAWL